MIRDTVQPPRPLGGRTTSIVLSFDVEEHDRIEAAAGLRVAPAMRAEYAHRAGTVTRVLLERLAVHNLKATFFVVGQLARSDPALVRAIQNAGHEVASHGWDHRRVLDMDPGQFREDLRSARDALEQAAGGPVFGYRAPTFSIVPRTAWAIDALADAGLLYDSSIFPVRHDRYGIPSAPRFPFLAQGPTRDLLELPPATWRLGSWNLPAAGGGYFRLFPPAVLRATLRQMTRTVAYPVSMLYFHPWEFDPDQPRLPLRRLNRFRTYVGVRGNLRRLDNFLTHSRDRYQFCRAIDVVRSLDRSMLPRFNISTAALEIESKEGRGK